MARSVTSFRDFVGQKKQVDLLRRQMKGAKHQGEPFPHTMVRGPSGVGKTLLFQVLAAENGTSTILVSGRSSAAELSQAFQDAKPYDFFFIDEAHNLTPKGQELLYQVIDEGRVPDWEQQSDGTGRTKDNSYVSIAPCTIILATDHAGKLLNALRKRMEVNVSLGFYTDREMKEIVDRLATDMDLLITPQASNRLAKVSWGVPRKAKHHLRNLRRHFPDIERRQVRIEDVRQFLRAFGIDNKGLQEVERKYLWFLAKSKTASLASLALHLGNDKDDVMTQIEPVLMRAGLIEIRSRGRQLSETGHKWINGRNKKT